MVRCARGMVRRGAMIDAIYAMIDAILHLVLTPLLVGFRIGMGNCAHEPSCPCWVIDGPVHRWHPRVGSFFARYMPS
jgi:hypothetical protein